MTHTLGHFPSHWELDRTPPTVYRLGRRVVAVVAACDLQVGDRVLDVDGCYPRSTDESVKLTDEFPPNEFHPCGGFGTHADGIESVDMDEIVYAHIGNVTHGDHYQTTRRGQRILDAATLRYIYGRDPYPWPALEDRPAR